MPTEENKAVYRRWLRELWEEGNLAVAEELMAPDFVDRTPYPWVSADREGHQQVIAMLHAAFPDWRFTIEHLVAEGDKVVGRWRMDATHGGDIAFMGIPASGKQVAMSGMEVMRIADGRIAEAWRLEDQLGLMQQLGVIPQPERARA